MAWFGDYNNPHNDLTGDLKGKDIQTDVKMMLEPLGTVTKGQESHTVNI